MTKAYLPVTSFRRYKWLLVFSVVAVIALWYWFAQKDSGSTQNEQAEWIQVQPQKLEQQLGLVGRIQAARQETVSAPFDGVIHEVLIHEGESVKAGQILVRLDPGQVEIQLRQAQAELLKTQREAYRLRTWNSSTEVSRARRAEQAAHVMLETTKANLRDTRALFERGIVARMEVDTLTQQVRAQQQDLLTSQEERRTVEARGTGEELKIAEMELLNAQSRYQTLIAQNENRDVKAPFDGVVVRPEVADTGKTVVAQPGLQVSQGTPLMTVIGLDRLDVATQVEESDLHLIREGLPVQVTGDGFAGQVLNGHVSAIALQSNSADSQGTAAQYNVVVSVDTPQTTISQKVRLGMSARVVIILYSNEHGIAVPPQALYTKDGSSTWVMYRAMPDSTISKIKVEPGRAVAQGIEIQGIQSGYVKISNN